MSPACKLATCNLAGNKTEQRTKESKSIIRFHTLHILFSPTVFASTQMKMYFKINYLEIFRFHGKSFKIDSTLETLTLVLLTIFWRLTLICLWSSSPLEGISVKPPAAVHSFPLPTIERKKKTIAKCARLYVCGYTSVPTLLIHLSYVFFQIWLEMQLEIINCKNYSQISSGLFNSIYRKL